MRKLDGGGGAAEQPSLVRQLYTLALLNRQDAMRRLHGANATDMALAQQPPSLLALARPPDAPATAAFRPSTSTAASSPTRRSLTSGRRHQRAPLSRGRFGAVSAGSGHTSEGTFAIAAARERSGSFGPGYGVPGKHLPERVRLHTSGTIGLGALHGGLGSDSSGAPGRSASTPSTFAVALERRDRREPS